MKRIELHSVDRADIAGDMLPYYRGSLESSLKIIVEQSRPDLLGTLIGEGLTVAGYVSVIDPESDELCRALRVAATTTMSLFALMDAPPGQYPVPLGDGREATLPSSGVTSRTHGGRWTTGFYVACILRDRALMDKLSTTPVAMLRQSSSRGDDCMYLWIEALQAWHLGRPNVVETMQAALDGTDPPKLTRSDEDFILNILVPDIELLFRLLLGEPAPFNEALTFALERHKKYWGRAERKTDPVGYLAFGPLAFAGMAHDAGIAITVESDYLPKRLFEGGCRT